MKKELKLSLLAASLLAVWGGANASLVQNGTVDLTGQGFGNAPRLLTIQATGSANTESGAIGISNGTLVGLTPGISDSLVAGGNGITNAGGNTANPLSDNQKFGIPTLSELGWTSGANVGLLFNATEPGGDGLNVTDVTLKFYNGNNVVTAIDGNFSLASTEPGNGKAGFLISVDQAQQQVLNNTVFNQQGFGNYRIALESTITGVGGGPESYSALGVQPAVPEPQTYAMMLAGLGLLGFARIRRNRRDK
jgi:hypothetical protein